VDMGKYKTVQTEYGRDFSKKDVFSMFNKPKVYDDMINNYLKYTPFKKAVCFCANVEHSKKTAENFRAHGIAAAHIDGSDPEEVREKIQKEFEEGRYHVLCNCAIYTFGWDCPSVEVVIINRATASYELWRQMIGRGARPFGEKTHFVVIDQGGNYDRHGSLVDEVEWTLEFEPKKKSKKKQVAPMKLCKHCEAIIPASSNICPLCKKEQPTKKATLAVAEFELITPEINKNGKKVWPDKSEYANDEDWIRGCIEHAKLMNHHANSALHHVLAKVPQEEKINMMKLYSKTKGHKSGWADKQLALRTNFNR